jgi:hypothetical protein
MQFYDFRTTRDFVGKIDPDSRDITAFYQEQFAFALGAMQDKGTALQMVSESLWEKQRRPYYNVYPAIAPMLMRLNLDVDTRFIRPPVPAFCVRLPKERPPLCYQWEGQDWHIRTILVGPAVLRAGSEVFEGMMLWIDTGEMRKMPDGKDYPLYTYINLPLEAGMSLEQSLKALPYDPSAFKGMVLPEEIRTKCARLICAICLLENDPSLIEPDVLNRDQGKDLTPAIINRAKRNGKYGWNIGKGIEVIPHVRRPHPALVWTGHGREVPKIVMRRGSVVHREAVTKIPTGFQGNDQ